MRDETTRCVLLFAVMLTVCGSARATITGIRGDGCSSPDRCSASFVLPVMRGKSTNVNIDGHASDLCGIANTNGVEVSGSGVTVSSLNRSPLDHRDFLGIWLNVDAAAPLGERTVTIRYGSQQCGPDTFKIKIVRGATVEKIEYKVFPVSAVSSAVSPTPLLGNNPVANKSNFTPPQLVPADHLPVNQKVILVFSGQDIGNAAVSPASYFRNVRILQSSSTKLEVELEFTGLGTHNVRLFDEVMASAHQSVINRFHYGGEFKVKVVTQLGNAIANAGSVGNSRPPLHGTTAGFVDVIPSVSGKVFRRRPNTSSQTIAGVTYFEVDNSWCASGDTDQTQTITVPDLVWGVQNIGTAPAVPSFAVQLASGSQILQAPSPLPLLRPGETRTFTFTRQTSSVTVRSFADGTKACYISPTLPAYFEDPLFTITVDVNQALTETQVKRANNTRSF